MLWRASRKRSKNALSAASSKPKELQKDCGIALHAARDSPEGLITYQNNKMVTYKCFSCGKQVSDKALDKRFTCQYCNSKIFLKPRKRTVKVKAI